MSALRRQPALRDLLGTRISTAASLPDRGGREISPNFAPHANGKVLSSLDAVCESEHRQAYNGAAQAML